MAIILNKTEFIIRRYVLAVEKDLKPVFTWIIGRGGDRLASGYIQGRDNKLLSKKIREAKDAIHFPSPEEIAEQEKKAEEEMKKARNLSQERMKKCSTITLRTKKMKIKIPDMMVLTKLKPIIDEPPQEIIKEKESLDIPVNTDNVESP